MDGPIELGDRSCVVRDSVTVIQDLPPGAIAGDEERELGRRYTNFSQYIDRSSGEIVLFLAEMPKHNSDDFTSDCIYYRIRM